MADEAIHVILHRVGGSACLPCCRFTKRTHRCNGCNETHNAAPSGRRRANAGVTARPQERHNADRSAEDESRWSGQTQHAVFVFGCCLSTFAFGCCVQTSLFMLFLSRLKYYVRTFLRFLVEIHPINSVAQWPVSVRNGFVQRLGAAEQLLSNQHLTVCILSWEAQRKQHQVQ